MATLPISSTKVQTWFERDRANVSLVDMASEQTTIVEWWDDDVLQAIDDGFLDLRDFHGSAYAYALAHGLLEFPLALVTSPPCGAYIAIGGMDTGIFFQGEEAEQVEADIEQIYKRYRSKKIGKKKAEAMIEETLSNYLDD